jgi:hypothetical protein
VPLAWAIAVVVIYLALKWDRRNAAIASLTSAATTAAARRAEYEHAALLRGDMATGIYGRYQPKL